MTVLQDPEAEKRSIMSQRVPRCNGHQDGLQCKHYWFVQANIQVLNADHFREGERLRRCMLVVPTQNLDYKDLATACNQYEPSLTKYDAAQEVYNPLTDEEIAALEVAFAKHDKELPFLAELALAAYKKLSAEKPDDPTVVEVRSRAAAQSADLETRKQEGIEARKRNAAEAAEREAQKAAALAAVVARNTEAGNG